MRKRKTKKKPNLHGVPKWACLLYCHIQSLDAYRPEDWWLHSKEADHAE